MKRDIVWTTKFKKDYKLAMKRHMDIGLLDDIIRALSRGEKLPEKSFEILIRLPLLAVMDRMMSLTCSGLSVPVQAWT